MGECVAELEELFGELIMWKYVIQDLKATIQYIPYGLLVGGLLCFLLYVVRKKRMTDTKISVVDMIFWMYIALMIVITFLSRESGSAGKIDLRIGSSLGINSRNDAYVIENILLFLPYGFLLGMLCKGKSCFCKSAAIGFLTSLGIECLQYISSRGVFQTDDLITNTIGAVLGYLVFYVFIGAWIKKKNKEPSESK